MEITFDFDIKDWSKFQQHHLYRSKIVKVFNILLIIFISLFSICILLGFLLKIDSTMTLLKSFFPFFIIIAIYLFLMKNMGGGWLTKRMIKKEKNNSQVFGQRTIILEDNFFTVKTENSEIKSDWNVIKNIDETPEYFYLYTSRFMAYVIPKCKINTNIDDLKNLLKTHLSQQNYKFYKK